MDKNKMRKFQILGSIIVIIIAVAIVFLSRYVFHASLLVSIVLCFVTIFALYIFVMYMLGRSAARTVRSADGPFFKEQNEIVRTYSGQYDKLLEALTNMKEQPVTDYAAGIYKINVADALIGLERDEEAMEILRSIESNYQDIKSQQELMIDEIEERKYARIAKEEEEREAALEAAAEEERARARAEAEEVVEEVAPAVEEIED